MKKLLVFSFFVMILIGFIFGDAVYKVTIPDGSKPWYKGNTGPYKILWDKKGDTAPEVKIRLFNSPGNVKVLNIANKTANNGSYKWNIPKDTDPGKYFIRVKSLNDKKWGDSKAFEIKGAEILEIDKIREVLSKKPVNLRKGLLLFPVIKSIYVIPSGAIKPGKKLIIHGGKFGTSKGEILLEGNFSSGDVKLVNIEWEGANKVSGVVPGSSNGEPNQEVMVVVKSSNNMKSKGWKREFVGREEKILSMKDVKYTCGTNTWCNICNTTSSGCGSKSFTTGKSDQTVSISGYHKNNIGDPSPDSGFDHYHINLKNGWVIKKLESIEWEKSSSDEYLSTLHLYDPIGKAVFDPKIHWRVSAGDYVSYKLRIYVEGPIGTHYK